MACERGRALALAVLLGGAGGVAGLAPAATFDTSHILTARWAAGTETGTTQASDLSWRPEADWRFNDGGRVTAIARLRWAPRAGLRPREMERASYASISRPALPGANTELELRELYYQRPLGPWYLTLGKQQVVWGKADGLKVLDVVDPQSFREFILEDFDRSRIPLWTLNAERDLRDWTGRDWTLQLLWIPDRTYHALPKPGATFAFTSPRFVPKAPPGVAVRLEQPRRPGRLLADSDAGARLTGFTHGWDWSLNYLYQYDNQPALARRFVPGPAPQVVVSPGYARTHLMGGTFSGALGDWVLRGELGYFTERRFPTTDPAAGDGLARSAELSYVLGLDWSGLTDTFVSGQLFQSWLPDHRTGFARRALETNLTLLARREFRNETLRAEVLWIASANDGDGLLRPKLRYLVQDNLEAAVGLDLFYGDRQGLFGEFDDNDRIVLELRLGL